MTYTRLAILKDGYARIPLGKNGKDGYAIVDISDRWLERHAWNIDHHGYARSEIRENGVRKSLSMHRLVLGTPAGMATDHINGNPLDNRKVNLRACQNELNLLNRGPQKNNKSGLKGVSWNKSLSKWTAQISIDGKQTYLGLFSDKYEAADAYDRAAKEHHKEFAWFNGRKVA